MLSDQLIGVIIGGTFGFLGALLGNLLNIWAEGRQKRRESLHAVRLRLVGDRVQTSEIMRFITSEREGKWPLFWQKGMADLSQATLEGAKLRGSDLRQANLARANISDASLEETNLEGAVFNLETIWPKGFDPEQAGAKLLEPSGSKTAMAEAGLAWIWGEKAAAIDGG